MVGMNNWGKNGRAGNQLFQWAFISSLARKLNINYVIPSWDQSHLFKGKFNTGEVKGRTILEKGYEFTDYSTLLTNEDINFSGFFQSEKYFDDKVKEEIQFKDKYKDDVKCKFLKLFNRPTISIGVRRTDYLTLPYYQLSANYYISALETHFPDWRNYNLVFISDDLEWCKGHFGCLDNAYFPETKDLEQMCLSSLCDHFIIANSTFHWWAAWMGEKEYSKIVQPTKLFIGSLLEKYGDVNFYSDRWITHEEQAVDLSDVTFTIPVYIDHRDRKENLELTVCLLQKNFRTNIIIGEQGSKDANIGVEYMSFKYPEFHRTKMLNDMAKVAKTKYIANWDCDVFVPPMQILQTVYLLRQGAKMVYPYDDKFCRIMRKNRNKIFPWYDIGAFFNDDEYQRDTPSFGGAVLWEKQTYFEIGGENEYFISFGPEDIERMERALALGIKIDRVKGFLYHFNHHCGPNSSVSNPHFKRNRKLLEDQRLLSKDQLLKYINSWPWHSPYTPGYYEGISEESTKSRDEVFKILDIKNQSIIDVGCGVGQWGVGLKNYTGIDYQVPIGELLIHPEQFIDHDIRIPFTGLKAEIVMCLEVAEHIEECYADTLIDTLCGMGDTILFSAAIPYQGGNNHVNEQWHTWWAEKFYQRGYGGFRNKETVLNDKICLWYRQNLVVYQKGKDGRIANLILPEYYEQIVRNLKNQIK